MRISALPSKDDAPLVVHVPLTCGFIPERVPVGPGPVGSPLPRSLPSGARRLGLSAPVSAVCKNWLMRRGTKAIIMVTCLALSAGLGTWVWFLIRRGLDEADKLSSVASLIAAVVFGVVGLAVGIVTLRQGRSAESAPGTKFNVTARRDAYTAESMTFDQRRNTSDET